MGCFVSESSVTITVSTRQMAWLLSVLRLVQECAHSVLTQGEAFQEFGLKILKVIHAGVG